MHGPISRVDIARLTALTNQTVFNITEGLQQIGLIRDFGRRTAERGQPAKLFEINADAAFSVGLHLERDHITGLLVDFKGAIRSRSYRGRHLSTPEQALEQALDSFRELRQGNKRILGLGIALPGPMDFRNGKVIFSMNFPGWEQVKVQDYFSRSTHNEIVMTWLKTAAGHLAEMIGNLILLFDPEAIVVGGHLPGPLLAFLTERCAHIIQEKRGVDPVGIPQILQGALQDEAAALGAAVLPMNDLIAPNYERITRGEHPSLLELWETEK